MLEVHTIGVGHPLCHSMWVGESKVLIHSEKRGKWAGRDSKCVGRS